MRVVRLGLAALGFAGLYVLTVLGPYAVSMVGLSTDQIDNAYPTRVTQGLLGLGQAGLVLAAEPLLRRLAARRPVWTATVLVSSRIMSIYLWHLTALGVVVALSLAAGGWGLRLEPDTGAWWATRPLSFAALALVTALAVALVGRFESPSPDPRPAPAPWRPVLAVVLTCAALGWMADVGIAAPGQDGEGEVVRWWLPLVPVAVSVALGVVRLPGRAQPAR